MSQILGLVTSGGTISFFGGYGPWPVLKQGVPPSGLLRLPCRSLPAVKTS